MKTYAIVKPSRAANPKLPVLSDEPPRDGELDDSPRKRAEAKLKEPRGHRRVMEDDIAPLIDWPKPNEAVELHPKNDPTDTHYIIQSPLPMSEVNNRIGSVLRGADAAFEVVAEGMNAEQVREYRLAHYVQEVSRL